MSAELTPEQILHLNLLKLAEAHPEATEELIEIARRGLCSSDVATREAAQELVVGSGDEAFVPLILELATDATRAPQIRGDAIIVLGPVLERWRQSAIIEPEAARDEAPLTEAREALEALYRDAAAPTLVRRRAVEAAIRGPHEDWRAWVEGAVRAAWASSDKRWRVTALFCMGQRSDFKAEIMAALSDDDPEIVREALRAAGSASIEEAGPYALAAARDPGTDRWVRVAAAGALGQLAPEGALEVLEDLEAEDDELLSEVAAESLLEMTVLAQLEQDEPGPDDHTPFGDDEEPL